MTEPQTLDIRTTTREEMVDVTALVRAAVRKAGVERGIVVAFCQHTTAGVTIQENADPTVRSDMLGHLRKLIPRDPAFQHDEGNADAHIKSSLIGASVTVPIEGSRLMLGHWQAIYFCEFDGPRDRRLVLKIIAG